MTSHNEYDKTLKLLGNRPPAGKKLVAQIVKAGGNWFALSVDGVPTSGKLGNAVDLPPTLADVIAFARDLGLEPLNLEGLDKATAGRTIVFKEPAAETTSQRVDRARKA